MQVMRAVAAMQAAGQGNPMVSAAWMPALAKNARTGHPDSRMEKEKLTVHAVGPLINQDSCIDTLQVLGPRAISRSAKQTAGLGMTSR